MRQTCAKLCYMQYERKINIMNAKILTMYLPQFHRVKENDKWWGEGFTEWTTVRGAKPLFEGHIQPVQPQNRNYYDLLDKETMQWQIRLMKKYGIDGICIYHYWFKDGRQILEKPAENMLKWKNLEVQYCFCWANETWSRTWSNWEDGNVWAAEYEKNDDFNGNGILLEQQYGNQIAWKVHFEYLLKFFNDSRYIKYDNKPVFVIYRPKQIFCLEDMMDLWNSMAIENGFNGIYFVCANCSKKERELSDLELLHEPQYTFNHTDISKIEGTNIYGAYDFDDVAHESLGVVSSNKKVSYGGFVGYDDTPRRGKKGTAILNRTPLKFEKYMEQLIAKNEVIGSPFLFVNAWNEWGEGMYLEPDEMYGEGFLEAIFEAKINFHDWFFLYKEKLKTPTEICIPDKKDKYVAYTEILHNWLLKKEMGRLFSDYLKEFEFNTVAIYGMGILGKHLISELKDSNIKISYTIDVDESVRANFDVPVYKKEQIRELDVDVIIVTVTYAFETIKSELGKYTDAKIISLEQIVMEC